MHRLLQDGLYNSKSDYQKFAKLVSRWRHDKIGGWKPDTLADETREAIIQGLEEMTPLKDIPDSIIYNLNAWTKDSHFRYQEEYIEVWFEARAMIGQFEKYASNITLCPFGGFTSIDFKWSIAKRLERMYERFGLPITILYFGDCDQTGNVILRSSVEGSKGLQKWCGVPFKVIWCGLTKSQAKRYNLPQNIEKPGEYQWEALTDNQASEIITQSILQHIKLDAIQKSQHDADLLNGKIAKGIKKAFQNMKLWKTFTISSSCNTQGRGFCNYSKEDRWTIKELIQSGFPLLEL